ncbi:M16 family metallopeptidase [Plebeiibacterium sediminum]|uniref:Insulinase family protein n=1 Tax=Plebeiibacterium sediminum TaxID=2992112 RepID=A0AAE3SEV7_9BACT|nr:pitrilysin family protein [Plebeiobacterium sediminum]MCW3785538.1 insulinase family protein [Plebeiobacterium sediminum]
MSKIKNQLILAFLLVSFGMTAQMKPINFEEFDLDNGLHVILHQDNSTPIVNVSVMYNVGSKNENPNLTGFAHFFEHLMFEGSDNIPRHEYSNYVEKAGGTLNANTSFDRTYYYEVLPSNQLELGLWLESERMLHAKVDSIGIATQKKVVIEEKKERTENTPYGDILELTFDRVYKEHPYRTAILGNPDHIRSAKDQDFVDFYNTFYVPNNACLVIAGDIDKAKAKEMVTKYFSDIPRGIKEITRPNIVEKPQLSEIRDTVYRNVQLPMILQAYKIPALGDDDYYAVDLLNNVLAKGQSSRLYKQLVDSQQKAIQVSSFSLGLQQPGVTLAFAIPNAGVDNGEVEKAMYAEVEKLQNELISEREFQKLKNQVENDMVNGSRRLATVAENLATDYTYFNDASAVNKELDKYLAVTREDIQRVAKKYYTKENRVVLYYLPNSQKAN